MWRLLQTRPGSPLINTTLKNPPIYDPPLYIAVTSLLIMQFLIEDVVKKGKIM